MNQACPFCGSLDLSTNEWCLIDDEETQAIECNHCFAGAPMYIWNGERWKGKPTPKPVEDQIELLSKEVLHA